MTLTEWEHRLLEDAKKAEIALKVEALKIRKSHLVALLAELEQELAALLPASAPAPTPSLSPPPTPAPPPAPAPAPAKKAGRPSKAAQAEISASSKKAPPAPRSA